MLLGTTSSAAELRLLCSAKNAYIGRKRSYLAPSAQAKKLTEKTLADGDVDTEAARLRRRADGGCRVWNVVLVLVRLATRDTHRGSDDDALVSALGPSVTSTSCRDPRLSRGDPQLIFHPAHSELASAKARMVRNM